MKNIFKKVACFAAVCLLIASVNVFSVSAASTVLICDTTVKPGDNITVTVKVNADHPMYAVDATVSYTSSVLKYVSGAGSASGNTLKLVNELSGETSKSYSITFTAIAEGKCTISASAEYSDINLTTHNTSASSVVINVAQPTQAPSSSKKPTSSTPAVLSTDASLSGLNVSGWAVTPAFSADVTSYSITVENSIAVAAINASAAKKGAKVAGTGDKELQVGDNKFTLTVTAPDGKTTKNYELNVRRATLEESVGINPTAVIIDGKLCHIAADLSASPVPLGFTLAKETYNGVEMDVFKSNTADYTLFTIYRDEDAYTDFYIYKELRDEFVPLEYMTINGNMVIFAQLPEGYTAPAGYYETAVTLGGKTVKAFCSEDERLSDIYVIYAYAGGNEQFFRFDNLETTLQRAPDFAPMEGADTPASQDDGLLAKWNAFDRITQIALIAAAAMTVVSIALLISLIAVSKRKRRNKDDDLELGEDFDIYYQSVNSGSHSEE